MPDPRPESQLQSRTLPADVRQLLSDALAFMAAKDRLLVAHRTGSRRVACAAIDKLDRLGRVDDRVEQMLKETVDA
jgi:hypothetical protein